MSVVVQFGSKQFVLKAGQKFIVDKLHNLTAGQIFEAPVVYAFGEDTGTTVAKIEVITAHMQGKKLRVVRYVSNSKNNHHKTSGFRPQQTVLKFVK